MTERRQNEARPIFVPVTLSELEAVAMEAAGYYWEPPCDTCDRTTCWCAKAGLLEGAPEQSKEMSDGF
jgi:hypothetical protein